MAEQRITIRITIPAIELRDAVELKEQIDAHLEKYAGASCELTAGTRTVPTRER